MAIAGWVLAVLLLILRPKRRLRWSVYLTGIVIAFLFASLSVIGYWIDHVTDAAQIVRVVLFFSALGFGDGAACAVLVGLTAAAYIAIINRVRNANAHNQTAITNL